MVAIRNSSYKHNEGQFEVLVPLRNAKFAFQPDWPALTNLDIELDFINDGLWMKTDGVNLGGVRASNLTAVILTTRKKNC